MTNQRKLEVLYGLERDLEALFTELTKEREVRIETKRLKVIKDEVIEYAGLMDTTLYPNITEEEKKVLSKKYKVELKLSEGYLKTRLQEVIEDLKVNVEKAIRQEQITKNNKGEIVMKTKINNLLNDNKNNWDLDDNELFTNYKGSTHNTFIEPGDEIVLSRDILIKNGEVLPIQIGVLHIKPLHVKTFLTDYVYKIRYINETGKNLRLKDLCIEDKKYEWVRVSADKIKECKKDSKNYYMDLEIEPLDKEIIIKKDKVFEYTIKVKTPEFSEPDSSVLKSLISRVTCTFEILEANEINNEEEIIVKGNLIKYKIDEGSLNLISNFKTDNYNIEEVKLSKEIDKISSVSLNKDEDSEMAFLNIDNIGTQKWYIKDFEACTVEEQADLILTSYPLDINTKNVYVLEIRTIEKVEEQPVYQIKFKPNRYSDITHELDIMINGLKITKDLTTDKETLTICGKMY